MDEALVLCRNTPGETSSDVSYTTNVIITLLGRDLLLLFPVQWLEAILTSHIPF